MKKQIQNDSLLRRIGSVLVIVGMITLMISTGLMIASFQQAQQGASAAEFAAEIQESLIPSSIGFPLLLAGIVMLVLAWFRRRSRSREMFLSND